MSTTVSPEVSSNIVGVYSPTWRIVPESDLERAKKPIFTPIRQTIFWLRTGQNANEKDMTQVREPFAAALPSGDEQTAFENGLQAALGLYGQRFGRASVENGQMIFGEYSHEERGMPAIFVEESDTGLQVLHTWVPATLRELRLR